MSMMVDIWKFECKLDKGLCRCCHSEGMFKSLSTIDHMMENKPSYLEALRSCFDIELMAVEGFLRLTSYSICEVCIDRLQDACNFKQQVLNYEKQFRDLYLTNTTKAAVPSEEPCKQEKPDPDDAVGVNDGYSVDIAFKDEDAVFDAVNDEDSVDIAFTEEDAVFDAVNDKDSVDIAFTEEVSEPPEKPKRKKLKNPKEPPAKKPRKPYGSNRLIRAIIDKTVESGQEIKEESKGPKTKSKGKREEKPSNAPKKPRCFQLRRSDYEQSGDEWKCTHCDKKYSTMKRLRLHIKCQHYNMGQYACHVCNKTFNSPSQHTLHKLNEHNVDDRFKCNACDKIFNTKRQLIHHQKVFHMLGMKFKCQHCEYECYCQIHLYKHMIKHRTVKEFHCRFCKKSFLRRTTLNFHEKIHTGDKRKVCAECGQAFVQKASLNYHMTKYHPEVKF